MGEAVRYETKGAIGSIIIDRPETKNALGPDEWRQIRLGVIKATEDDAVRLLVVTGSRGNFCSGGDIRNMPERNAEPPVTRRNRLARNGRAIRALRDLPKPTIAVIDGYATGAGLALALACDMRIASSLSRFGATFHKVGLTADFGITYLLPDAVGISKALDLLLFGEIIDAAEAHRIGLVHRVFPAEEFAGEADELVEKLATLPTLAVGLTKQAVYRSQRMGLTAAMEYEAASQAIIGKTDDAAEGIKAFLEKRKPKFQGK
jgi:2-(1,2-epoxy-1,2-dihydrophenyl)acetyl-CoA isomerase